MGRILFISLFLLCTLSPLTTPPKKRIEQKIATAYLSLYNQKGYRRAYQYASLYHLPEVVEKAHLLQFWEAWVLGKNPSVPKLKNSAHQAFIA